MKPPALVRRQAVAPPGGGSGAVRVSPLTAGSPLPTLVTPATRDVDLGQWSAENRVAVDDLLHRHKALLFRGFRGKIADRFAQFVTNTSAGPPLEYRDRTTPRTQLDVGVYTSTVYPAAQRIRPHNEGTYWTSWPLKIYFGCAEAPAAGGETPIFDVAAVYRRLPRAIADKFEALGFTLVRNFNDGFGLTWQEVFQTSDRGEVEAYCDLNHIRYAWRGGDRLNTSQSRPAVRRHPRTGGPLWFNHVAFFHHSSLPDAVRGPMISELGVDGLPFNTRYGDGSEIPPDVIDEIHRAYEAERVAFTWQEDDLLLLDNMSVAHAREPFTGRRLILTSMAEPWAGN